MLLYYNLSDPGIEDLLYEVESVGRFVALKLTRSLPDETAMLKSRHRLEEHGLAETLFEEIRQHLERQRLRLSPGTIVDASILVVLSSTVGS